MIIAGSVSDDQAREMWPRAGSRRGRTRQDRPAAELICRPASFGGMRIAVIGARPGRLLPLRPAAEGRLRSRPGRRSADPPLGYRRSGVAPITRTSRRSRAYMTRPSQASASSAASCSASTFSRRAARALPRGRLRGRHGRRQPTRDPRRGPPALVLREAACRLVQRPPGRDRRVVRPVAAARCRHRQRQRGDRRRAHAPARPRRAGRHRRRRPRARPARSPRPRWGGDPARRRGPVQAAFTNPELQELGEMTGVDVQVDPAEVDVEIPEGLDKIAQRNVEILRAARSAWPGAPAAGSR